MEAKKHCDANNHLEQRLARALRLREQTHDQTDPASRRATNDLQKTEGEHFYLETTCKDPTLANDEEEKQELIGKNVNQAMYLVIRSLKDADKQSVDYHILEGDILKFGKIAFRVR